MSLWGYVGSFSVGLLLAGILFYFAMINPPNVVKGLIVVFAIMIAISIWGVNLSEKKVKESKK